MSRVQVLSVDQIPAPELAGAFLDSPGAGQELDYYAIPVSGWAISRHTSIAGISVLWGPCKVLGIGLGLPRPDVAASLGVPGHPIQAGFFGLLNSLCFPAEFTLQVAATLEDGRQIPFAAIRGKRVRLPAAPAQDVAPLLMTTLGRCGSSRLLHLLGQHPKIAAYEPFRFETRVCAWWTNVLHDLAKPQSFFQCLGTTHAGAPWWLGGGPPPNHDQVGHPDMADWLARENIEAIASLAGARITALLERMKRISEKPGLRYFVEKNSPEVPATHLIAELLPRTREVFLVRDFRDVICSALAFCRKRGIVAFGRDLVETDAQYVDLMASYARFLRQAWDVRGKSSLLIRYEDLVRNPRVVLRAILEYLALPDSGDSVVRRMIAAADRDRAASQAEHRTTRSPLVSISRFRDDLDPDLLDRCWELMGADLRTFGYAR